MVKRIYIILLLSWPIIIFGQNSSDTITFNKKLEEVNINALRANEKTPITFTNISKEEIKQGNLGQDLPYIISLTPSIVTTSDAGAGIGYTSFRVRGSDPTRINVTVNGVPLNDSESQGVWWVNMPDFTSSIGSIQIQRGVGTSTNGGGAFGASVNLKTNDLYQNSYAITNNSIGSYKTIKNNIEFGTGLIKNKFTLDGRLSKITSDGYIDRAFSNLESFYMQGAYFNKESVIKAIIFSGHERTYQAWNGVPLNYLDTNRTFNPYTYENEVDNYTQTHYQLHYSKQVSNLTNFNITTHYTHGEGYYEQKKLGEELVDYSLNNIILANDTINSTDLIRRKWLNNNYGGLIYSITHKINNFDLIIGGAINNYSGQHYGNIIWAKYASNGNFNHQYYWNKAEKTNYNFYAKANYQYNDATTLYLDLQKKSINYNFEGKNEIGNPAQQEVDLEFFNPKFGIYHIFNKKQTIYASFGVANKEPNRNDYVESTPISRPSHETLYDTEIGYKQTDQNLILSVNIYNMSYKNQLALTGKINDVGAYTHTNIDESFRRGIEVEGVYKFTKKLIFTANITTSENIIKKYTEYIDNWDTWEQETIEYENTELAFSPKNIWASNINYKPNNHIAINFISKYVGKQFIDNTSSKDRSLDDYLVNNLRLSYKWNSTIFNTSILTLQINNLLNNEYVSNAWVYRFISDNWDPRDSNSYVNTDSKRGYNMAGFFPEATRNYLLGITLGF